jgi:hypothetical protein
MACPSVKADGAGQIRSVIRLRREGVAVRPEATDFTLPRKAAGEIQGARTANRHR